MHACMCACMLVCTCIISACIHAWYIQAGLICIYILRYVCAYKCVFYACMHARTRRVWPPPPPPPLPFAFESPNSFSSSSSSLLSIYIYLSILVKRRRHGGHGKVSIYVVIIKSVWGAVIHSIKCLPNPRLGNLCSSKSKQSHAIECCAGISVLVGLFWHTIHLVWYTIAYFDIALCIKTVRGGLSGSYFRDLTPPSPFFNPPLRGTKLGTAVCTRHRSAILFRFFF